MDVEGLSPSEKRAGGDGKCSGWGAVDDVL